MRLDLIKQMLEYDYLGDFDAQREAVKELFCDFPEEPSRAHCRFYALMDVAYEMTRSKSVFACANADKLLDEWLRLLNIEESNAALRADIVRAAQLIMSQDFTNPELDLTEISGRIGTSTARLAYEFRRRTNKTVMTELTERRIGYAKKLLKENPSMTVCETAEKSGYRDSGTFLRAFKKLEGVTPTEYRERSK